MNPFEDFLTSEITIIKKNREVLGPLKADVQNREIHIFDVQLQVEAGDQVLRVLPNGVKETYTIENAEYEEGFHAIPASYRLHVRKDNDATRDRTLSATNIFNVKGDFSRVNFQSNDSSLNIQQSSETVFDAVRRTLHEEIREEAVLKDLLTRLQEIEAAKSQSKWASAYSRFIEVAANHMTIIAPFLPLLSETASRLMS